MMMMMMFILPSHEDSSPSQGWRWQRRCFKWSKSKNG